MRKRKTASKATSPETTIDLAQWQLLTVLEVAKLLGIGRSMAYVLINNGELQGVNVGSGVRVLAISVQQYIMRNMRAS